MQIAAFTGMIHQAVAITEVHFLGDYKHDLSHPCCGLWGFIYL
jgi:hypothetical protein